MSTPTAERPTLSFDHHSPVVSRDRRSVIDEVRQEPVFFTEAHGGYWVVTSHALAKQVLRDSATFSSQKHEDGSGGVTVPTVVGPRLIPAEVDPPYHRALRKVLAPKFNIGAVDRMRPALEALVRRTIDRVIEKGSFDVVHDIADVIPAGFVVDLLGFSEEERVPFIRSVQSALAVMPQAASGEMTAELQEGMAHFARAVETINALVADRRSAPQDDLVSYLAQPEHELSDEELLWLSFTLIVGGAENPAALIANSLLFLQEHPDLRSRLAADPDPEKLRPVIEELLRDVTAGVSLARNVTADVELGGQRLKAGERIVVWLPAVNHDPEVFEDPDRFDETRPKCPHMAFGDGPHFCIGATLARLQMTLLLTEVLTRMPNYVIDVEASERFDDAATMYGFRTMPAITGL